MKTSVRLTIVVGLLAFNVSTATAQAEDYTYITNNGTITITGYTGPGGAVYIPSEVNGLPVTALGNSAFRASTSLTSVSIPDSVVSLGWGAFSFSSLTSVTIGNGVPSLDWASFGVGEGIGVFSWCSSLANVLIGNSVVRIDLGAFEGCASLNTVIAAPLNPHYSSLDGVLFDKDRATLTMYPFGRVGRYTVPNGVINIGFWAFSFCSNLTDTQPSHGFDKKVLARPCSPATRQG